MMLAAIQDYLHLWQLPLLAGYGAIWLIAGPYLTRLALRRATDLPRQRTSLAAAARVNFLANGAANMGLTLVGGALVLLAVKVKGDYPASLQWPLYILAAVGAPAAMLTLAWAGHWALLDLPAGRVWKIVLPSTGVLLLLALATVAGAAIPAVKMRQEQFDRDRCQERLLRIDDALKRYAERHPGKQAPSLEALAEEGLLGWQFLQCPANHEDKVGYLYVPALGGGRSHGASQTIHACDRRGNHGQSRMVLFVDGHVECLGLSEFADLLGKPGNADLAKLVAAE